MSSVSCTDPTPNNFPDDYDSSKVDDRIKLRSESLKHKQEGKDVREALYQGLEIGGTIASEAKATADSAKTQSQNIDDRFNDQIAGSTNDNEVIDFRHSDMLSKSFTTSKTRGDFWDSELQERGVNVKWFGAAGDGTTDDTKAIQTAINFFKNSDFKTLIFEGTFLCSKVSSDSDSREYALIFDSLENKNIDLTRAKFITGAVDDLPNLLAFYNCSNINVTGGQAEANTSALVTALSLYNGAFIYANNCTNINIKNTYSKNMCYTACLFNCSAGCIQNNIFTHTQQQADRTLRPASAILLYNSSHIKVLGNDVNGGLRDGDISVFGSNSYFNLVAFNHLRSDGTNWEEAITVDGGAVKTVVSNNTVEGFYNYGIEAKYNSQHTLISSNYIYGCVVSISIRGGEMGTAPVFETVVENNYVIFGNIPSSQGWNNMRQTGINVNQIFNVNIHGNHLTLGNGTVDYVIYGISIVLISSKSNDYYSPISISDNYIELQNGANSNYNTAGTGSCGLILDAMRNAKVSNNTFKAPSGLLAVKLLDSSTTILFDGNFFETGNVTPIQYYGDASCENLIITENNVTGAEALSNAYLRYTTFGQNHNTILINNRILSDTGSNAFLSLSTTENVSLIVKVKMLYDYNGTFVVDSTYKIYLTKTGMTVSPIFEKNSDVSISEKGISANTFGITAEASRSVTATDVHFYVDIYGQGVNNVTFS